MILYKHSMIKTGGLKWLFRNTRIIVTINKKLKEKLKLLAKEEQRSVSNLCSKIVSDYIKGKDK